MVKKAGFTLIEVVVAASLISVASAIIIPNLPRMNSRFAAELLSYDVALAIRGAQTKALTAPSITGGTFNPANVRPYGVNFRTAPSFNKQLMTFKDNSPSATQGDHVRAAADSEQVAYAFQSNSTVSNLCAKLSAGTMQCGFTVLDVTFRRPSSDAIITTNSVVGTFYTEAGIQILSPDTGVEKCVHVYSTGQVSVQPAPCS